MSSIKHFKCLLFAQTLESNDKCGYIDTKQRTNTLYETFQTVS